MNLLQTKLHEKTCVILNMEDQLANKDQQIDELKERLDEKVKKINANIEEKTNEIKSVKEEIKNKDQQIDELKEKHDENVKKMNANIDEKIKNVKEEMKIQLANKDQQIGELKERLDEKVKKINANIEEKTNKIESVKEEIKNKDQQIDELKKTFDEKNAKYETAIESLERSSIPQCPYIWKIENFKAEFEDSKKRDKVIYSKSFYCLTRYKARLSVKLNHYSIGRRYILVCFQIIKGPFDSFLEWPIRYTTITIKIMINEKLIKGTLQFSPCKRPTEKEETLGDYHILHHQLPELAENDTVSFFVNIA